MSNYLSYIPDQISLIRYGVVITILNYVLISVLLVKLARMKKLKNTWLSWLPIGNMWIFGKIIGSFQIGKKRFSDAEYRLTTSSVVFLLVAKIPILNFFVGFAFMILVISCIVELIKYISHCEVVN